MGHIWINFNFLKKRSFDLLQKLSSFSTIHCSCREEFKNNHPRRVTDGTEEESLDSDEEGSEESEVEGDEP